MGYCTVCHQDHEGTACPPPITACPPPIVQKTPFKCPVCDGSGTVSRPPHIPGDVNAWSSSDCALYDCQACSGTGIVWG